MKTVYHNFLKTMYVILMFFPVCIGVLSSCAMGGSMPVFSVLFGDVTAILGYEDTQKVNETSSSVLRSRTGTLPGGNPNPFTNPLVSYNRCLRIPCVSYRVFHLKKKRSPFFTPFFSLFWSFSSSFFFFFYT